jgi:Metal-dependent hydrolases of the beta-lactamase superfamily II
MKKMTILHCFYGNQPAMKISAVIDNLSECALEAEHGLSLFVEVADLSFFFDLGQSDMFLRNAAAMGIDVSKAGCAVISHGHYDHGGGLAAFLEANKKAKVLLSEYAFGDYRSLRNGELHYIGLDKTQEGNDRLVRTGGVTPLGDHVVLFSDVAGRKFYSPANGRLYSRINGEFVNDSFAHEQNAIVVEGDRRVLIAGCAHSGIVNIIERAESILGEPVTDVLGGMHLKGVEDDAFIDALGEDLSARACTYYTCHCTGEYAFTRLKSKLGDRLHYFSAGSVLQIP